MAVKTDYLDCDCCGEDCCSEVGVCDVLRATFHNVSGCACLEGLVLDFVKDGSIVSPLQGYRASGTGAGCPGVNLDLLLTCLNGVSGCNAWTLTQPGNSNPTLYDKHPDRCTCHPLHMEWDAYPIYTNTCTGSGSGGTVNISLDLVKDVNCVKTSCCPGFPVPKVLYATVVLFLTDSNCRLPRPPHGAFTYYDMGPFFAGQMSVPLRKNAFSDYWQSPDPNLIIGGFTAACPLGSIITPLWIFLTCRTADWQLSFIWGQVRATAGAILPVPLIPPNRCSSPFFMQFDVPLTQCCPSAVARTIITE